MAEDKRGNEFVVKLDREMSENIFHSVKILLVRKTVVLVNTQCSVYGGDRYVIITSKRPLCGEYVWTIRCNRRWVVVCGGRGGLKLRESVDSHKERCFMLSIDYKISMIIIIEL